MTSTSTSDEQQTAASSAAAPAAERRARTPRARKPKDEGQWAVQRQNTGELSALNHNEEFKLEDNPLNVRQRIIDIYSKEGFRSIPKDDLRGRFRWMGCYTQRRQGFDGSYTGDENIDLIEDEHFMMRVRSDGALLTPERLRALGSISHELARNTADISDRGNIQFHWIRIEDIPEIWERLEAVGLSTTEACGDSPRGFLVSPLAGLSPDEVIDPMPAVTAIIDRYIGDPEFSNLPRKFKTAISGLPDVAHEINDIGFIGVEHPEHGPGYDLWVGGGLSTNPMLAQRVGAWVSEKDVPDVWHAIISIFRDYGYRRLRAKARLKFLIKDWGVEKFRSVLEEEYLGRALPDGPAARIPDERIDHIGVTKLTDGTYAVGGAAIAGRISGTQLLAIADAVEAAGAMGARLTPYQKFVVVGVPEDKVDELRASLDANALHTNPTPWRRNLMACTGIEYCKLSFTETRSRAQKLLPVLEDTLENLNEKLDTPVTVHINGCPNSCARIQVADIGFKGQLVKPSEEEDAHRTDGKEPGSPIEAFQVHLGGALAQAGNDADFGRKLRGHKILADDLTEYVERVVRNFVEHRAEGQRFAEWAAEAAEELLR